MYKAKLCSFAIACIIGCTSLSPIYAYASETNIESVTLSENDNSQKDKKAAFEDAMKKATDQWNTLSDKQKSEVYALIENEMKSEIKLMDKLVEFGIINKDDATNFKARLMQKFKKMKESGEFPLVRQKGAKSSK